MQRHLVLLAVAWLCVLISGILLLASAATALCSEARPWVPTALAITFTAWMYSLLFLAAVRALRPDAELVVREVI